jgi:large subunit ribosomal protein L28
VRLRIAASTLRTIEKRGGLDGYLALAAESELPGDLVQLKRRIAEAQAGKAA